MQTFELLQANCQDVILLRSVLLAALLLGQCSEMGLAEIGLLAQVWNALAMAVDKVLKQFRAAAMGS